MEKLSHQEILFVHHLLTLPTMNLSKAAQAAGVPKSYASRWGRDAYARPEIQQAINEAVGARLDRLNMDADTLLTQLIQWLTLSLDEVVTVDESGRPSFDFSNVTPEFMRGLTTFEISPGQYGTKYKLGLPDRLKIAELIGKHIAVGAFREKIEHDHTMTVVFDDQDRDA